MFVITSLVLIAGFLFTAYSYLQFYYFSFKNRSRLPCIAPQWLVGNLRNCDILSGRVQLHEVFATLKEKFGDAYAFWVGPYYSIVISRVEYIQHVLSDRRTYDVAEQTTSNFSILFPNGLIALRGDAWKRHARFILPMFKRAKVTPYLNTIGTCMDRFIDEELVKHDGEIRTDLVSQCQNVLLNVIALIAFDYDLEGSTTSESRILRKAFNDFVQYANKFVLLSGIPRFIGKLVLLFHWKYQQALRTVRHYVMNIINEEQKRQKAGITDPNPRKNLIASLVSSMDNESPSSKVFLTPQEVFDEVLMSILAGFETTSTALSWFIFYMSKHPHVQEKMKDELKEHGLTYTNPVTQEELDSLTYIECVVKEVLRLAPIATAFSRSATRDDMIDNIPVKQGDMIVIATQNVHRDPRYWKLDPTQFLPERFLNEDKNPPAYAYMPFGGGHRACAGQDLAFFELKIAITRLMQRVTFEDPGNEADNSGGYIQRITCFPKHMAVRIRADTHQD